MREDMTISGIRGEQLIFEGAVSAPAAKSATVPVQGEGAFSRALRGLGREIDVGEKQTAGASQLRSYDTASLIALQVGIYRYTEAVDLASKIVDRATSAVKTVLQGGGH
jgi:hypothetical protein